ncbi:MAG: tetratricopeptide repeat protein, partial [Flavobacteriales bacterium]|nr:tetratricopeptide repeat protein [Flavobacteriales bacterium]
LILILIGGPSFSSSIKEDQKIESYYVDNLFYKILKYKSKKEDSLSAKSLFYKGMSAFMLKQDHEALDYFIKSINRDGKVGITFYQKGITLVFLKDYRKAIDAFDMAIQISPNEPKYHLVRGDAHLDLGELEDAIINYVHASSLSNCPPSVYTDIAFAYGEMGDFNESREAYAMALKFYQPNADEYAGITYNIGFAQQMNGDYFDAKKTFEKYLLKHPYNYAAMAKLIQINYELNNIAAATYLKKLLRYAYDNKQLKGEMRDKYCIDQFYWNGHLVFAYEFFENNHDNSVEVSHIFQVKDKNKNLICELQLELDSTNTNSNENVYYLCIIKDDLHQKFGMLPFTDKLDYTELKLAIINVLNDQAKPTEELDGYAAWCKYLDQDYNFGFDGSSFNDAIVASSVPFEYNWIMENFPEANYKSQRLFFHEGKPFDILIFEDKEGRQLEFYFNISAFYADVD